MDPCDRSAMRAQPSPIRPIPIWIGGLSDAAIRRALRFDGWHASRISPDKAAGWVKRLRAERPGEDFTIFVRVAVSAANSGDIRTVLGTYRNAGVQHVLAAPEDRDLEDYPHTAEAVQKAAEEL
jgi:hypothetical protein